MTVRDLIRELLVYEMDSDVTIIAYDDKDNYQLFTDMKVSDDGGGGVEIEIEDAETALISYEELNKLRKGL